jgi:hypothetical protein
VPEIGGFEARNASGAQDFQSFGRVRLYRGIGKKFYGKSNYDHDSQFQIEEFDTTFWFVLLYFPLLPLRSYRIRRKYRSPWNIFGNKTYQMVHRIPRRWGQIFLTWIKALILLFVLQVLGRVFVEYLRRQAGT